jgi:hypothetical protein
MATRQPGGGKPGARENKKPSAQTSNSNSSDRFSDGKIKRVFAIGAALFPDKKGDALAIRIREAASKILNLEISSLHDLHWKQGEEIMKKLEEEAIKKGVWNA